MTRPTRIEVDCSTGAVTEIELTDAEIAQREADAEAFAAQKVLDDAEQELAQASKESAQAKLAALGLTAEEIAALSK